MANKFIEDLKSYLNSQKNQEKYRKNINTMLEFTAKNKKKRF